METSEKFIIKKIPTLLGEKLPLALVNANDNDSHLQLQA